MAMIWIMLTESDVSTILISTIHFTGIAGTTILSIIHLFHSRLVADGVDIRIMAGAVATGVVITRLITAVILHIGEAIHLITVVIHHITPDTQLLPDTRIIQAAVIHTVREDRQEQLLPETMEEDRHRVKLQATVQQEIRVQTAQLLLRLQEDQHRDRELAVLREETAQKLHRQVL